MEQFISGQIISTGVDEIIVAIEDEEQCHTCGLKDSCSNKTLTLKKSEVNYTPVKGEQVQVIYKKLLQTSLLLYVFPLLAFFAGIAVCATLFRQNNELVLFLTGTAALAIALFLLRLFGKHLNNKEYRIEIKPLVK